MSNTTANVPTTSAPTAGNANAPATPHTANPTGGNIGTGHAGVSETSYAAVTANGGPSGGSTSAQRGANNVSTRTSARNRSHSPKTKGNALKRKQPTGGSDPQPARPPPAEPALNEGGGDQQGSGGDNNPEPEIIDDPMHGEGQTEPNGSEGGDGHTGTEMNFHNLPTVYVTDNTLTNPHFLTSHMGDAVTAPPTTGKPHTSAIWPNIVISSDDLVRNFNPTVLHNILEEPYKYLALVPYGGGYRHQQDHPDLAKDIQEFLQSFAPADCEDMAVIPADPANASWKNNFDQPWALILIDTSADFRAWLLREGTFAFLGTKGTKHAFTVRSFAINVRSWHITHLVGYGVSDKLHRMSLALQRIFDDLSNDADVRTIVDECFADRTAAVPDTLDEKMVDALSTLSLQYSKAKIGEKELEIFTLMGKPITDDKEKHRKWLTTIRKSRTFYIDGVRNLVAANVFEKCDFCKSETHPEGSCPFPSIPDWKGPSPKEVRQKWAKEDSKGAEASSSKGKSRDDGNWKGKDREDTEGKGKGRDDGEREWRHESNKRPRGGNGPRGGSGRGGNRRRGRGY